MDRRDSVVHKATAVDSGTGPAHRSPLGNTLHWVTGDEETAGAFYGGGIEQMTWLLRHENRLKGAGAKS